MAAAVRERAEHQAEERLLDLLLPAPRRGRGRSSSGTLEEVAPDASRDADPGQAARASSAPASSTSARSRSTCRRRRSHARGLLRRRAWRRWASTSRTCSSNLMPAAARSGGRCKVAEARRPARPGRGPEAGRHGRGRSREAIRPGRETPASSSSTRSTRSRAARAAQGPDVSREGVQRDLLPIVEGSTVTTKYGMVRTDHVLFIAAGAFHVAKPSDLIPELQGRFPIRVELEPLTRRRFRPHPDASRRTR